MKGYEKRVAFATKCHADGFRVGSVQRLVKEEFDCTDEEAWVVAGASYDRVLLQMQAGGG